MGRGKLRIYLGAAPGVGKTYAMLSEAHRRVERGADCVVAFVEHHGRPRTEVMLHGLEQVPRREIAYRGSTFTEMDVDAVLARRPAVALVDELPHTNVPGSRNHKRWQDVEELLAAGIDVISTANIQHLESLGDVVESITGVRQKETVPDEVVRRADQIELVDMSPEALRRRMAHGNVYRPDKVDAALSRYFRPGNLTGLREPARLDHLVGSLLDMSRLRTGTVMPVFRETGVDEVVPMALGGMPEGSVVSEIPETLPVITVDRGLLERAVANIVENAVKYAPAGAPVLVSAGAIGDRVELRVIDRGPGIPDEAKDAVFEPFQRYGDAPPRGAGIGLGLAVARGFVEAMGGTVTAEDTPGGGLTMVVALPVAPDQQPGRPGRPAATC
ncbi:ATP-binding protein [Streptomyces fradiae]|uniref:ATP-binding protein n=1 Tax=Streptomyces fradiae TaxID=1906 RepID=UPI002942A92B|nr:ATP-binding protein [Streptomyces fradiae]WOI61422.1 ATP-binding protein [Streptomyces fradiae]